MEVNAVVDDYDGDDDIYYVDRINVSEIGVKVVLFTFRAFMNQH